MSTVENKTNGETAFHGVSTGDTTAVYGQGGAVGVRGDGATWHGVVGISASANAAGVSGSNTDGGPGVIGESSKWMGVYGKTDSTTGGAGVMGEGVAGGPGVIGKSQHWHGVYGETSSPAATGAAGVWGDNKADGSGVVGQSVNGAGIFATSKHGPAAVFQGKTVVQGDLEVSGDIRLLGGDLAELFETRPAAAASEPGTLMCLDEDGRVAPSDREYDKKAIGIVAGAGAYRPGLILDAGCGEDVRPIAMIGKVYCQVDASFAAIEVGDLLTSSPTVGHAMKATDPSRALGAVVGKALAPMADGTGLLPIVVTLQ
ncbi:hypothetical protein GCM10010347_22980 [Streptomyces cirratus]|uniref:Uncharacterized protein n=1 Tax=Streptomyces cirratus TaxID=68187 RepID=A0ABQ3EQP7_9ACTN|nr:hypothetical protein [Streptomyces cirratus]GHB52478.1 hypothetical protein GCM10010347_22980 [Streptomyces cirratus]